MGVVVREKVKGSGEFWIFVNHGGQRKARKVGSKKAAAEVAKQIEARIAAKVFKLETNEGKPVVLFRDYAKKWLDGHVRNNLKASSRRHYRSMMDVHLVPAFGAKDLLKITRAEIRDFSFGKLAEGLEPQSVKGILIVLSSLFNHAIEDEVAMENPARNSGRYLKVPNRKGQVDYLTPVEIGAFLAVAQGTASRLHPLFLTALRTGMRQGELIALQWDDIDQLGKFIEIRRSNFQGAISTPKSGRSRRVDMSDRLAAALAEHRRAMAAEALREGRPISEWVFTMPGGEAYTAQFIRKIFTRCLKKAGMRHVPFHAMRHSYASALISLGESLAYVRDQLGHSSIQITVDNYGHLVPGANREAVNRLDRLADEMAETAPQAQPV